MPQLLLELGTEELPASAVRRAFTDLGSKISSSLAKESVLEAQTSSVTMGTPRRLIVAIDGVETRQPDSEKKMRGPGLKGAYDANGNPTPALLGFCRGQGVEVSELSQDGQYVWATKQVVGRAAGDILAEVIPAAIRSLAFDKTMRWGSGKMRFARPIRWILATLDGVPIEFELEGVNSSNLSFGHRFYAPEPFEANTFEALIAGLRERHVEPDPARRRDMILRAMSIEDEDRVEISEALLDENVFLTEWPTPILGRFNESFLELPAPVLTTVMAKHEKMFPVRTADGEIDAKFIFVRNSGQDASVRKGCEWVLNARMNDAKFFFDEDLRSTLDGFLEKTKGIVFQEKLGTVFDRSHRLATLAASCGVEPAESPTELQWAYQAGKFSKADLATGLVSELASLQGIVGGIYANRANFPEAACHAISRQYDLSEISTPSNASDRTWLRLLMADQADKLAGYLGIGLEPSGSSDPYGLRRSVTTLIETAWAWPVALPPFVALIDEACNLYENGGVQVDREIAKTSLCGLFAARYGHLLPEVRHDILEAALASADPQTLSSPKTIRFRARVLSVLAENESFVQASTRPLNILAAARKKGLEFADIVSTHKIFARKQAVGREPVDNPSGLNLRFDPSETQSDSAIRLYELAERSESELCHAIEQEHEETALTILRELESPINEFFEQTMVMAEEASIRFARLTVVNRVSQVLLSIGDFTKIVFSGETV
jgi:glycyl-tRNA synthetase beta chain